MNVFQDWHRWRDRRGKNDENITVTLTQLVQVRFTNIL